jgi:hypothetical protein
MSLLFSSGSLLCGLLMPSIMSLIGSNTSAMEFVPWILMASGLFFTRLGISLLSPFTSINRIHLCWESLVQVGLAVLVIRLLLPSLGLSAVGIAMIASVLLCYRLQPLHYYRQALNPQAT